MRENRAYGSIQYRRIVCNDLRVEVWAVFEHIHRRLDCVVHKPSEIVGVESDGGGFQFGVNFCLYAGAEK